METLKGYFWLIIIVISLGKWKIIISKNFINKDFLEVVNFRVI